MPGSKIAYDDGSFNSGDRAIVLGLSADGLNPFANEKNVYPMWPILLNLPKSNAEEAKFHAVNRNNFRSDFDPYVDIIVDEILNLNSVRVYMLIVVMSNFS